MTDRLKDGLSKVHAEEELKDRTKAFLYQKTNGYTQAKPASYRRLLPAAACFLFLIFGGHWLYFTPTVEISIDVNPSLELGVNRFDKIVSVQGYNDDGKTLADSLDIKYLDYTDAIDQVLASERISELLADNEIMAIGVIGSDDEQSATVLAKIESCMNSEPNAYCYYANSSEVEKAHELGLSYGKYQAYLELQSLAPEITAKDVQNMTMREIRELIKKFSDNPDTEESETGTGGRGPFTGRRRGNRPIFDRRKE